MDSYSVLSDEEQAMLCQVFGTMGPIVSDGLNPTEMLYVKDCLNEDYNSSIDPMLLLEQLLMGISEFVPHEASACAFPSLNMTTLMVRNVPRRCTQRMLMSDIVMTGFGDLVDFVYLPTDISSGRNLGYAFLNFMRPESAESFRQTFHKKHLTGIRGSRAGLSVSFAMIQGLQANVDNVLKTAAVHRIRNPEYLPLIRDLNGHLVPSNLVITNTPASLFRTRNVVLSAH